MSYVNPLLKAWSRGETTFGAACTIPHAVATEIVADSDADFVFIDHQHGWFGLDTVVKLIQGAEGRGTPAIVRVPLGEHGFTEIERVLDAGASGVVVPVVNTPQQALRAVAACRYPPTGRRSFAPSLVSMRNGTTDLDVLNGVVCSVQIESAEGLENVGEILAVPGVDAVCLGPIDLAISLGEPMMSFIATDDPLSHEPIKRIKDACDANGVVPGVACGAGAAQAYADAGFRFITAASDVAAVQSGLSAELAAARGSA